MSDLILPGGVNREGPAFVAGRRLKLANEIEQFVGCVLVLRHPTKEAEAMIPHFKHSKIAGTIQTLALDPMYPKRIAALAVLSVAKPGGFIAAPVQVLEASDPWVHPPGLPDQAVSLLES